VYFFIYKNKIQIRRDYINKPLFVLVLIIVYSVVSFSFLEYDLKKLFQQSFLFFLFIIMYGTFFSINEKKLDDIFKGYLNASFVVSILGLVQVVFYYLTFVDIFAHFSWLGRAHCITNSLIRLHSICPEGGQLGTVLSPAIVYIIYFKDKWNFLGWKKWVIVIAGLMTFSITFFIALFFSLYFRFVSKNKIVDIIVLILLIMWGVNFIVVTSGKYSRAEEKSGLAGIEMRLAESAALLFSLNDLESIKNTNTSTYAWMTNFYVSRHAPYRIFGTGLGSHQQNYLNVYHDDSAYAYGLNSEDGYSLLNRIFSEFGILGLICYICMIFRHVDRNDVVSFSVLFFIIGSFLRGGNYFLTGCIFFHYLFFLAKKQNYQNKLNAKILQENVYNA